MIIGVTGRIATGKTSLAHILEKRGFYRIDADKVYHGLLESSDDMKRELSDRFGGYDRESILSAVRKERDALDDLNLITHGYVAAEILRLVNNKKTDIVLDVPVPVKIGFLDLAEYIIVTTCSKETQLERVIARDGIPMEQALFKINMQKNNMFYNEIGNTIINTECMTMDDLVKTIDELLDFYK